jgi:transcriptional regulator with XRE-family HTH domain
MNKTKKENLEKVGWKVGAAQEFLGLTPEEESYVELKLSLSQYLQEKRKTKHLTQIQMAKLISSSQSRVAKMEKAESSVSIDLILRSLFALGTETGEIADILLGMEKGNIGRRKTGGANQLRRPIRRARAVIAPLTLWPSLASRCMHPYSIPQDHSLMIFQ